MPTAPGIQGVEKAQTELLGQVSSTPTPSIDPNEIKSLKEQEQGLEKQGQQLGSELNDFSKQWDQPPEPAPPTPEFAPIPSAPVLSHPVKHDAWQFALMALAVSALSGGDAKLALADSTSALAGAVDGANRGNLIGFKENMQRWKAALDTAQAYNNDALKKYAAILQSRRLTAAQKQQQMMAQAANLKDMTTLYLGQQRGLQAMIAHLQSVQTANAKLGMEKHKIMAAVLGQIGSLKAKEEQAGVINLTPQQKSLHGEAFLKTLDPAVAAMIRAIGEGRLQVSSYGLRSPQYKALLELAMQAYPHYDQTLYEGRLRTREYYTSGAAAQQIRSLNMVLGHLAALKKAGIALKNGNLRTANLAVNLIRNETGNDKVTNFNTAKQAVVEELEKTFRGSSGSERDIAEWSNNFSPNASERQLKGAWNTIGLLLDSRITSLGQGYQQAMGTSDTMRMLYPEGEQAYRYVTGKAPPKFAFSGESSGTESQSSTAQVTPAPPAAVEYLKDHPSTAPEFYNKYGYLPGL